MALTYTPPHTKHFLMPQFELRDVQGKIWSSSSLKGNAANIFVFMCNHCPYVKAIENRLIALASEMKSLNVGFIGICSNDSLEYPEDAPQELLKTWLEKKFEFTYLVDQDQTVARKFDAVCTPDFFVFDQEKILRYRGRLDDSWKDATLVRRQELREAVLAIIGNRKIDFRETPSMGCSIKWKDLKS